MESSPPLTPPTLKSQSRLRSRPVPPLTEPFEDPVDSPALTSPSPKNSSSPLHLTIQELLLLPPPYRRPKLQHSTEVSLYPPPAEANPRRKGKTKPVAGGGGSCISPRSSRRARRRFDKEILREHKELGLLEDEAGKVKKRKPSRPRPALKEKLSLVPLLPPAPHIKPEPENIHGESPSSLDGLSLAVSDLIMWQNVAKSTLWFGLGSILFLSSILSGDVGFSIISAVSHLGILILFLAFFYDSVKQRKQEKKGIVLQLTENDVIRAARVIFPVINAALAKIQQIFSGEPLMTLKVAPVLLFMAKYGYLITLWRLLVIGFLLSFTAPKLYSCYYPQIQKRVEDSRSYVIESWKRRSRKKLLATTAAAVLWNILSIKMRIFAAFIIMVILRYHHQQRFVGEYADEERGCSKEREQEQRMEVDS